MKIGIYGGTYNPIHLGHAAAAKCAVETLGLDRLYLIPAGMPPHKELADGSPSGSHRLAMVQLAAESMGIPGLRVSGYEQKRKGRSYTANTLKAFSKKFPADELWLLMGADMFLSFHTWYHPEKIAALCKLCVFRRSHADEKEAFFRQKAYLEERYHASVTILEVLDPIEISSTRIRETLREETPGGDTAALSYLAPPVYGYILRHHLYGTREDLKNLPLPKFRAAALSHLKGKRIPHVLGTEETAAALASRWGEDEETARRCALLHDCTKRLSKKEHLELCRIYHWELDSSERREEQLLHAKTGALVAKEIYGFPDHMVSAIACHTTGKENMTLLEKIIYLADYIEPNRSFDGLEPLRELAFQDLDRAMLLAFDMTIRLLEQSGGVIHPDSRKARDYLKGCLT